MSIGLYQFGVGTTTSATQVAGVSGSPGNDQKLKNMLAAVKLRNRAQPMSLNTQTSNVLALNSNSGGTDVNTQYVVYKLHKDSFVKSVDIQIHEAHATSGFPEIQADAYLTTTFNAVSSANLTFTEGSDSTVVQIMRNQKIQAAPAFSLVGGGFPKGILTLPLKNQFIPANRFFVLKLTPPDWNGASVEGLSYATVTMHFAEFHQ